MLDKVRIMISSTVQALLEERGAVDEVIESLGLHCSRSETTGSI